VVCRIDSKKSGAFVGVGYVGEEKRSICTETDVSATAEGDALPYRERGGVGDDKLIARIGLAEQEQGTTVWVKERISRSMNR
jgi:hypothetical protein